MDRTTNQSHNGTGDNVDTKIVNTDIQPSALRSAFEKVLSDTRSGRALDAKRHIETLSKSGSLSVLAIRLIEYARFIVELELENGVASNVHLPNISLNEVEGFYRDLVELVLFKNELMIGDFVRAEQVFSGSKDKGPLVSEAYLQNLADKDFLESFSNDVSRIICEEEYSGLVAGFIRNNSVEKALELSHIYNKRFPSPLSKSLYYKTSFENIMLRCGRKTYWLLDSRDRDEIDCLIRVFCSDWKEFGIENTKFLKIGKEFFWYFGGIRHELVSFVEEHSNAISLIDKEFSSWLIDLFSIDDDDSIGSIIRRAQSEPSFQREILQEIESPHSISARQALIFCEIGSVDEIKNWLEVSGDIDSEYELEKAFLLFLLKCSVARGEGFDEDQLSIFARDLVKSHGDNLIKIQPSFLKGVIDLLVDIDMPHAAKIIGDCVIPKTRLWPSPLVVSYIKCLVDGRSFGALENVLSRIPKDHWVDELWEAYSILKDHLGEYAEAKNAILNAIQSSPSCIGYLQKYFIYIRKGGGDLSEIEDFLCEFDCDTLDPFDIRSWQIVSELYQVDQCKAESLIVRWFIRSPDELAEHVTNFNFSMLQIGINHNDNEGENNGDVVSGFRYFLNGKEYFKLVGNVDIHKSIGLNSHSPLGKALLEMKVDQVEDLPQGEVRLIEIVSPYVSVCRLATTIRHDNNDGSDVFKLLNVPSDPDKLYEFLVKEISRVDQGSNLDDVLGNRDYPISMKVHKLGEACPVMSSIKMLSNKVCFKFDLIDFGDVSVSRFVVDCLSSIYLSITGIASLLDFSKIDLVVTKETKFFLEEFIKTTENEDYFRIGVDQNGRLSRVTHNDVNKSLYGCIEGIRRILDNCNLEHPRAVDIPPEISKISDFVDGSLSSSFILSFANDIPIFSLDPQFSKLHMGAGGRVCNASKFVYEQTNGYTFIERVEGIYLHVSSNVPYPIRYSDMIDLAGHYDKYSFWALNELILKYASGYQSQDHASRHLAHICCIATTETYYRHLSNTGLPLTDPSENGRLVTLINTCFRAVVNIKSDNCAEERMGEFMQRLFAVVSMNRPEGKWLISIIHKFLRGHFLCLDEVVRSFSKDH